MKVEAIRSTTNELSLSFTGTDISTLYIIQYELEKNPDVEFVGVILKHPLTNECWMRVTSKSDPKQNIQDAVDAAISSSNEIKDTLTTDVLV
ncbi:MAG: hypothetical protein F4Y82_00490 [Cenarchaeum sp. SB0665_bin_23]|nr:hypothetical protein [Cenarchaeum sp. SB0667_bin_13]MXY37644.1 hypothetical protein [Cenarchaeum sp. SB0664_bin_35]MXY60582.1 hypothetical protein [Cenarchaeum sp. SB0665_bin_23]MXZ93039.1 hypothetical protein [Cenarchaeum sp. SB0666_bin_15]MYB46464.1 hypothetical protein [Cenarchaeum sp. SB0662_bin_33]MYC79967.1 hypothetical protein [Cenarchaeum sp. SB0661_bin_35]MYD59347.1 hypothetical protein [Cenarchaeum sp. SB0678_bin_8]MYG32677.1 hypothetical protein [Cenarchaeum sp. SB0677_bin_16]